jgi:phosphopantothenoylcysteine decarboxylase/phosphopantothenate--cysteine ligase
MLVNAGPTREYIDTVRFLSNASSGRMGYAIARQARQSGHQVVLVSGPVAIEPPAGVELVHVVSADEMLDACRTAFDGCEAAVLTAAVCDYRPVRRHGRKLKKGPDRQSLDLEPTPDIAAQLGARKGKRVIVGFALEDHEVRLNAEAKLAAKRFDAIVLNSPATLGAEVASVEFLVAPSPVVGGAQPTSVLSTQYSELIRGVWSGPFSGTKDQVAAEVVRLVERLVGETQKRKNAKT